MTSKSNELEEAKKWLSILLEDAPDAFFLSTVTGTFLAANKAAENMIGYKREELIGKNMLAVNILPKDQIPVAAKRLAQHALGKSVGAEELQIVRKDGRRVQIEVTGNIIKIKGHLLVLGIVRDITERKRMEEELKKKNEELEKFYRIAVGREFQLINYKKKIKELEEKLKELEEKSKN
ncbi:MAG: PAS domain S-box protein [Candidatus Bilamarchaeaceae archaeon]